MVQGQTVVPQPLTMKGTKARSTKSSGLIRPGAPGPVARFFGAFRAFRGPPIGCGRAPYVRSSNLRPAGRFNVPIAAVVRFGEFFRKIALRFAPPARPISPFYEAGMTYSFAL